MKTLTPSRNAHKWPRKAEKSVECRKRDLVIRITDWTDDKDEPAYDVECYVGGVYDFNLSKTFCTRNAGKTNEHARLEAVAFASAQIAALL
jgi:hypothetical protein